MMRDVGSLQSHMCIGLTMTDELPIRRSPAHSHLLQAKARATTWPTLSQIQATKRGGNERGTAQ